MRSIRWQQTKKLRKKTFEVSDQVTIYFLKERFSIGSYNKLKSKKYGSYQVFQKINDDAYLIEFSLSMSISLTFNINNICEYHYTLNEDLRTKDS